jgi:hypothetical protein
VSAASRRVYRLTIAFSKDDVDPGWDVLITTYQLAQGAEPDRKFLSKSVKWEVRQLVHCAIIYLHSDRRACLTRAMC